MWILYVYIVCMYVCTVFMYVCMYVCMYKTLVYVCMYVCMYVQHYLLQPEPGQVHTSYMSVSVLALEVYVCVYA